MASAARTAARRRRPRVGVQQGLLDDDARLVVPDGARVVEALGIEVGLRDGALAQRRAEHADRICGAEIACLDANVRQNALQGRERLGPLGGRVARGDAIGVARAPRLGERVAQRELRPGVRGSAQGEAGRREREVRNRGNVIRDACGAR